MYIYMFPSPVLNVALRNVESPHDGRRPPFFGGMATKRVRLRARACLRARLPARATARAPARARLRARPCARACARAPARARLRAHFGWPAADVFWGVWARAAGGGGAGRLGGGRAGGCGRIPRTSARQLLTFHGVAAAEFNF